MTEKYTCPECGAGLPADAPGGLCPKCLMVATRSETGEGVSPTDPFVPADRPVEEWETILGTSASDKGPPRPAESVDLDGFKRAVQDLGLIRPEEFERFVAGALGGVPGLARALVQAGKLTPYQAGALCQGKARGLVIGNYFILDKLGAGGMGVVFKARHRRLGRIVALKILPPSLARDRDLLLRFRREVDVAARLSHPNIVSVLDADEDRGVQFMTMEFIEGNDLDRLVREHGPLPVEQALDCVIQAARGLEAAHAQGIVHRDIKPGNLMLDALGQVRVLDLGLARLVEASNPFSETVTGPLTRAGICMGTADYMAPEQGLDSRKADFRADIYSLGCTLYYLLARRPPFVGPTVLARLMAHQEQPPPSLQAARPEVSPALEAAYRKMMAKRPSLRPGSMTEVIALLEACRSSAGEAEQARSALKSFSASMILNRAEPRGPDRDPSTSSFARPDDDATFRPAPDRKLEDVVFDHRDEPLPVLPALPPQSPKPPKAQESKLHSPRKSARRSPVGVVLGALVLLGLGGLGYSLIPRPASKPKTDPGTPEANSLAGVGKTEDLVGTYDVATRFSKLERALDTVAVTADGRLALTGGNAEVATLLDLNTGRVVHDLGWQGAGIIDVAISADGRRGLVGTWRVGRENLRIQKAKELGLLWFWDLKTGKQFLPRQQPHPHHVNAVAISADGRRGLSGGDDGSLKLWDLETGKLVHSLGPQEGYIHPFCILFHPDGRRALSGGKDRVVHVWDLDSGEELVRWTGHQTGISGLALTPDGRRALSGSNDGTVILWDVEKGSVIRQFSMPQDDRSPKVAFDSDGNILAAGNGITGPPSRPGHVILWDARTYDVLRSDERPFARHLALAALPGGRFVTTDRYALRLWTPRDGNAAPTDSPASADRDSSPVDLLKLISPERDAVAGVWQIRDGALFTPTTTPAYLNIPFTPPAAYRIDMKIVRQPTKGDAIVVIGLLVGGHQTALYIDRPVEATDKGTGLDGVDGVPISKAERIHSGQVLYPSRPAHLSVTVQGQRITLSCDGKDVFDWSDDPRRLIRSLSWHAPDKKLFLNATCPILVRTMNLTPL
jgi:serine/threonine protein kinase/WD40 repeat protein